MSTESSPAVSQPKVAVDPPEKQPGIALAQIFLERLSFEHRVDALSLPPGIPPKVGDLNVNVEIGIGGEGGVFGFTRITVSTNPAHEPVYNVVLAMTGLFARQSGEAMPLETFLKNNSVALMYPFVRETFANITGRGRCGPIWLNPFNTQAVWAAGEPPSGEPPQPKEVISPGPPRP